MAKPIANLRLFVAAFPPPEVVRRLLEALATLKMPARRVTPPQQVHLTLLFIGDMPATEIEWTAESVERSAAGLERFELTPMSLISLPERGPARLVAAETTEHPTLTEIQKRLAVRLATTDPRKSSERFRPHMTLARFNAPTAGVSIHQPVECPPFIVDPRAAHAKHAAAAGSRAPRREGIHSGRVSALTMGSRRLHHVQVLCPEGGETAAREFYGCVLGLEEIAKPLPLARDGVWFALDDGRQIHVGVRRAGDEVARSRAHFAVQVDDLAAIVERLRSAGCPMRQPAEAPGWRRVQASDPFGNGIELLEIDQGFGEVR